MTSAWSGIRAKLAAVVGLAALAAACLTLSAHPPPDPILRATGEFLRWAGNTSLRTLFLLMVSGGLALLGGLAVLSVHAYLKGRRAEGWAILLRRLANTLLGYGLLTLIVLGIRTLQGPSSTAAPPAPTLVRPTMESSGAPPPLPPVATRKPDTPVLAYAVTVAALLVGGGLLLALRRRPTAAMEPPEPEEPELLAGVRRRLQVGDQVRDAIIACYADMCDIFLRKTPGPSRNLTAREFAAALRFRGVQEPEILALTSLFEQARYSLEPCSEPERERALAALCALEARYATATGKTKP